MGTLNAMLVTELLKIVVMASKAVISWRLFLDLFAILLFCTAIFLILMTYTIFIRLPFTPWYRGCDLIKLGTSKIIGGSHADAG
jgi:hypothetical protein